MKEHTTHFDDCGCLTAKYEKQLAELEKQNNGIKSDFTAVKKSLAEKDRKIHMARNLWCDSKRNPETGYVDIKYLDEFEKAIQQFPLSNEEPK